MPAVPRLFVAARCDRSRADTFRECVGNSTPSSCDMITLAGITLPFLGELVALLAASILIAYLCYRIRLVPIVGFLLAGVVLGPTALGLVTDRELIDSMAEVGVILLLFTIGVEFSLEKLARIRRMIVVGGGLQVLGTTAIVVAILVPFGIGLQAAIYTGFLVALSSTAIVLTLLADRNESDSPKGRFALAILIFQDLAIIVMVLLVSALGGDDVSASGILLTLGEAVLIIVAVLIGARTLVPTLLERIALTRKRELFLPTVVAICFGTAWITSQAGVSLALGAFLAGLVVSESRYSEHALSEILPLRTIFNAVFFASVGMLLDLNFLLANLWLVLAAASVVLVLKVLVTAAGVLAMRYPMRIAAAVGLTLAQIGEFSFVLERAGAAVGLSPAGFGETGTQTFIAVTVLLMALTPLFIQFAPKLGELVRSVTPQDDSDADGTDASASSMEDHVIVAGFGPGGVRLANVLHDSGIAFIVVELNPSLARDAEEAGYKVVQGDAASAHILEHAGVRSAKICVVVVSDEAATLRITEVVNYLNPTVQIIVRTRFLDSIEKLQSAGADIVVPEELETAIRVFTHVLQSYMITPEEIQRQTSAIRSGDYRVFRGSIHEAHLMVLQGLDEEGLHTRAVVVRQGAPVAGRSLRELDLRQNHNLTVLAVRRQGRTIGNPSGAFRIEAGDRLILVGSANEFIRSATLFRAGGPDESDEPLV